MEQNEGVPTVQTGVPDSPSGQTIRATFSGGRNDRLIESTMRSIGFKSPGAETPQTGSDYTLVSEIGRGGMGVVYRARQAVFQREIALKTTHKGKRDEDFITEALVTAHLEHPNIVPVYDLTTTEDLRVALAMKLIGGTSWLTLLHPNDEAQRAQAEDFGGLEQHLEIFLTLCNAVAFAHSKSIAHLDIKPENVLVGEFGEVLVVDWGLSMDFSETPQPDSIAPHRSTISAPFGTPSYMAPEQALAKIDHVGPSTDIYLLGATLYEIVTGRPRHGGNTALHTITEAGRNAPPVFTPQDGVPEDLQAICTKATATMPEDRYESVSALQDDLRDFIDHRESLIITQDAEQTFQKCVSPANEAADGVQRTLLYDNFAHAVACFRQAQLLWPGNLRALKGEVVARKAFAEVAVEGGDLGLARAQLDTLPAQDPDRDKISRSILAAERDKKRSRLMLRLLRVGIALAVAVITGGSVLGYFLISSEKRASDHHRDIAEGRLGNIERLADSQRLSQLRADSDTLWPALPESLPRFKAWLEEASPLLKNFDTHQTYLTQLREQGKADKDTLHGYRFDRPALQWEHDTLSALVTDLKTFEEDHVKDIRARLTFASTIRERSIDKPAGRWKKAIEGIKASPHYGGLEIKAQLGLVPIGENPATGLWEFVHLQTGKLPERNDEDQLIPSEEMGIVLVLLPGDTFNMGAQAPPKKAKGKKKKKKKARARKKRRGKKAAEVSPEPILNLDPKARESEGPVHEVTLDAFFISKYEMTQAQWRRFTGHNPSTYLPGQEIGGRTISALHPVEQVRWKEAFQILSRMGLTLPTEAQWEYAIRGGSQDVYWTGDTLESLQNALNIADSYCQSHGGPGSWRYEMWLDDGYVTHAPVGSYRANGFGLHDAVGNVWEWCLDRYGPYTLGVKPGDGQRLADDKAPRVFRGGGFRASVVHARSADRYSLYGKDYRAYDVGVRPARKLER